MQSALGTAQGGHSFQRMVNTQTPGTRDTGDTKVAGAGQREGGGLTDAPQPDDAHGALRESIATHPQGFPRAPATAVGKGGEVRVQLQAKMKALCEHTDPGPRGRGWGPRGRRLCSPAHRTARSTSYTTATERCG